MTPPRIRVLVVDDSAFARKVVREVLSRDLEIEVVGIARDGLEALEKISELKPDVVTLDLIMPDLDGLGVLRALSPQWGVRVVLVSVSGAESDLAIEALELGAIDLVTKPTPLPTDRLYDLSAELIAKVKAAARAKPRTTGTPPSRIAVLPKSVTATLLAIGTSTGGPQALTELIRSLPEGFPVPVAVALHIPSGYTAPLAARISKGSRLPMAEAQHNQEFFPGQVLIAPGGSHLRVKQIGFRYFAQVSVEPRESLYHPSVDLLFESVAEQAGAGARGVILTGMGNDGLEGCKKIRKAGGRVLAESESSCVVYGMPRSVIEAGEADGQAPLEKMGELILKSL